TLTTPSNVMNSRRAMGSPLLTSAPYIGTRKRSLCITANFVCPDRNGSNSVIAVMSAARRLFRRKRKSVRDHADDLAIWIRALAGGKLFHPNYQRQWLDSLEPQDPSKPLGQKYGYGISQITFGPNSMYFHGGEMPGYNSFMGYDPVNDVTLVIWTNLTLRSTASPPPTASC